MTWKEAVVSFADYDGTDGVCVDDLTDRAKRLRADILQKFPTVRVSDSPECRVNTASTSKQSIHGDGRALDIFAPRKILDTVVEWLITRSDIQIIIYDRFYLQKKSRGQYKGPNPHEDHIHVEVPRDDGEVSIGKEISTGIATSNGGTLLVLLFVALAVFRR